MGVFLLFGAFLINLSCGTPVVKHRFGDALGWAVAAASTAAAAAVAATAAEAAATAAGTPATLKQQRHWRQQRHWQVTRPRWQETNETPNTELHETQYRAALTYGTPTAALRHRMQSCVAQPNSCSSIGLPEKHFFTHRGVVVFPNPRW